MKRSFFQGLFRKFDDKNWVLRSANVFTSINNNSLIRVRNMLIYPSKQSTHFEQA